MGRLQLRELTALDLPADQDLSKTSIHAPRLFGSNKETIPSRSEREFCTFRIFHPAYASFYLLVNVVKDQGTRSGQSQPCLISLSCRLSFRRTGKQDFPFCKCETRRKELRLTHESDLKFISFPWLEITTRAVKWSRVGKAPRLLLSISGEQLRVPCHVNFSDHQCDYLFNF